MAAMRYFFLLLFVICFYWKTGLANSTDVNLTWNTTDQLTGSIFTTNEKYIRTTCEKDDVYKDLRQCVYECKKNHGKILDLDEPVKTDGLKISYKVVELAKDEFSISNGYLLSNLPKSKLPPDTFSISNETARVCYPLDDHFVHCMKYYMQPDEYEWISELRSIWIQIFNRMYSIGEFYLENGEALVCTPTKIEIEDTSGVDAMFIAAYSVSCICLVFTIILSIKIPQLNIRGNTILLCHLVTLAIAYFFLALTYGLTNISSEVCLAIGIFKQFFILGAFFWINVQAIDLFSRIINIRTIRNPQAEKFKFILYSFYAWGCPFIICIITLILAKSDIDVLRPNFDQYCWFFGKDRLTVLVLFYGPISIILFVNLVLYILTIIKMCKMGKDVKNVNKKIHNKLMKLYLKLIVVMGLCWILEIVSWAAIGGDEWNFTDMIVALQGLFIFIVYVCKPSYIRTFLEKSIFCSKFSSCCPWKRNETDHVEGALQNENDDVVKRVQNNWENNVRLVYTV